RSQSFRSIQTARRSRAAAPHMVRQHQSREAGRSTSAGASRSRAQSCFGSAMFQSLSDRLSGVLDKLTRRGSLTDSDVSEAMREVRRALLEADVALDVVPDFTD